MIEQLEPLLRRVVARPQAVSVHAPFTSTQRFAATCILPPCHRLLRLKLRRQGARKSDEATEGRRLGGLRTLGLVLIDRPRCGCSWLEIALQGRPILCTRPGFVGDPGPVAPLAPSVRCFADRAATAAH